MELDHAKARIHLGEFFIYTFVLSCLYVFAVKAIEILEIKVLSTTIISIPVLSMFGIAMLILIRKSDRPLKFYGVNLVDWKKQLIDSIVYSLPFVVMIPIFKWLLIEVVPSFNHLKVFELTSGAADEIAEPTSLFTKISLVASYVLFVPVQELIYRGAMQTTLERLLISKNRTVSAILVTSLPFSLIHLHISLSLCMFTYLFGVFWGWMYSKHKSLLGCTISHILIGFWAFFICAIHEVLIY